MEQPNSPRVLVCRARSGLIAISSLRHESLCASANMLELLEPDCAVQLLETQEQLDHAMSIAVGFASLKVRQIRGWYPDDLRNVGL